MHVPVRPVRSGPVRDGCCDSRRGRTADRSAQVLSRSAFMTSACRLAGLECIDVLINNADLVLGERRMTADGVEHVFALNTWRLSC